MHPVLKGLRLKKVYWWFWCASDLCIRSSQSFDWRKEDPHPCPGSGGSMCNQGSQSLDWEEDDPHVSPGTGSLVPCAIGAPRAGLVGTQSSPQHSHTLDFEFLYLNLMWFCPQFWCAPLFKFGKKSCALDSSNYGILKCH